MDDILECYFYSDGVFCKHFYDCVVACSHVFCLGW